MLSDCYSCAELWFTSLFQILKAMKEVWILCKRPSKQLCWASYNDLYECWVENRKMTFSLVDVRATEPPLWKEMRTTTAASFLPFQNCQCNRERVWGEALAVKEFEFNHLLHISKPESKGQHNLIHYHFLVPPARSRAGAGWDCAAQVLWLRFLCGCWGHIPGHRGALQCPLSSSRAKGHKPLSTVTCSCSSFSHHCLKDSSDTEHYWLHLLCPLLDHPCPPHPGTSNSSHVLPAPAGGDSASSHCNTRFKYSPILSLKN